MTSASTNAMIWFCVHADVIRPTARNTAPIRNSPAYPPTIGPQSGSPTTATMIGNASVRSSVTSRNPSAAKYLPRITPESRTGIVTSSSSVPERRSSDSRRIETAGR